MTDLRWLDDLDFFGAETADAAEELVQDIYHVVEEDLASNLDDPTRGLGVANMLSGVLPANFTTSAESEIMQDDRVAVATVELDIDDSDPAAVIATLNITIEPTDEVLGELDLQVPVGSAVSS